MWMATSKMSVNSFEQGQMIPIQSLNSFIYSCFMFSRERLSEGFF
jgi:hypothetical protein